MKIRSDIVKVYKDVHIWTGVLSGLMLFIAFYAGAISVFEKPLKHWATPPSMLAPAPSLSQADELIDAVVRDYPQAASHYRVMVNITPEAPARVIWTERSPGLRTVREFGASFDHEGALQVSALDQAPVAQFVDTLHQDVGLPLKSGLNRIVMGVVSMLYAIALISGLIILLPTIGKDLFAMRLGKQPKRVWLDTHNALGLVSLPFHLIIALTSVVFAFHDEFYDVQERVVYRQELDWGEHAPPNRPANARLMSAEALLASVNKQLPDLKVDSLVFRQTDGMTESLVTGQDIRYGTRMRTYHAADLNPYTGRVNRHELPEHMGGYDRAVNSFFMLHFGSFGGNAMRWLYLLMGLAGAVVFYTGNLLWIESRRKKQRNGGLPAQQRNTRVLAALTVGISLGCVAGISSTVAAAKWMTGRVDGLAGWHEAIYFSVFLACVAWALSRGAARAAVELLRVSAATTLLVPLSSVAGMLGIGTAWSHFDISLAVDVTATAAALLLLLLADRAHKRVIDGAHDSVWSVARHSNS